MRPIPVEIYSAPGCSLCGPVVALFERVAGELGLALRHFDISREPTLRERFRTEIPVVFLDGHKAYTYRVDEAELRRRVERLRGEPGEGTT